MDPEVSRKAAELAALRDVQASSAQLVEYLQDISQQFKAIKDSTEGKARLSLNTYGVFTAVTPDVTKILNNWQTVFNLAASATQSSQPLVFVQHRPPAQP